MAHTGRDCNEQRPLLRIPDSECSPAGDFSFVEDATVAQILRAAIPAILITVAFEFSMDFITVAFSQLIEGAICSQKYPDVQDPYSDPTCKNDDVQAMLSFVKAWETSLAILPGLLMALPYGMVADKYGPKRVLLLVFLGNIISLGLETVVCLRPDVYDIRLIWAFCLLTFIGGGSIGWEGMKYTVADGLSGEKQRTTTFFYLHAVSMASNLTSGPLVYLTMKNGPIVTQVVGLCLMALAFLLTFALPDVRKRNDEETDSGNRDTTSASFQLSLASIASTAGLIFRDLFWNNLLLGFLLASQLLTTIGGQEVAIRLQYVTRRYGWTWGEAGLLSTISGSIDIALFTVILPALSQLLIQKFHYTAFNKDVWLTRVSGVVLVLGSLATGLAPTTPWLIFGVAIYELSKGYIPALASLIASVAHNSHSGLIYVAIAMMRAIGAFVAGPSLSATFNLGLKWGGGWLGLPFFYAASLQFVAAIIVFTVRPEENKEGGEGEDD